MAQCLKFMISGKEDDERAINVLKEAAKAAINAEIDVKWLAVEDILGDSTVKLQDGDVIVCESFEGEIFEALKRTGKRIFGPQCIITCIQSMEPLPSSTAPLLNLSMPYVVACCTNILGDQRSKLKGYIVAMGGDMIGDFTQSVTHLIAGEVGSKKYQVACDIGKPIVQPSWVTDCWEQSKYRIINDLDKLSQKHACPCFKGLTICVTGLSAEVRQEVKKLTESNGGKYSGELNMRTCTHLIVRLAKGEKYNYARQWKIHCVSPQWFYECVRLNHWINEDAFEVRPGEESIMDESKILDISRSRIDMTLQSDMETSVVSSKAAKVAEKSMRNRDSRTSEDTKKISSGKESDKSKIKIKSYKTSELKLTGIQVESSMLLDGCKIYLSEIPQSLAEQLRKMINAAGAMRFNQLNSSVTHIIIGDVVSKDVQDYLEDNIQKPYVVSPEWLVDSCKDDKMLDEKAYSLVEVDRGEELMAKPSKIPERKASKTSEDTKAKERNKDVPPFQLDDDFEDDTFLGQYLPQAESSRISSAMENKPHVAEEENLDNKRVSEELHNEDLTKAVASSNDQMDGKDGEEEPKTKVLQKAKFVIKFFEEETADQLKSLIEDFDGKVVQQESRCDYILVPLTFEKRRRIGKKEVTICWLEQSVEKQRLLESNSCFLFRPFHLPPDCLPLKECVLSISQFCGMERDHLVQVAEFLGAVMQDSFARKAGNGMQANTHLLLEEAFGAKYEAACNWGIECVSKEWLFACAEKKRLMSAADFPLKEHVEEGDSEEEEHDKLDNEKNTSLGDGLTTATKGPSGSSLCNAEYSKTHREEADDVFQLPTASSARQRTGAKFDEAKQTVTKFTEQECTPVPKVKPKLQIGKPFRPSFDLNDMMEYLKSPASCFTPRKDSRVSNSSFALDEFVGDQLRKAVENMGANASKTSDMENANNVEGHNSKTDVARPVGRNRDKEPGVETVATNNGILKGVVIAVSKKLLHRQTEIHNLASLLGADCRYIYDESCTHLIHQGKVSDMQTEVKKARSQGKYIVSDHWLEMCLEKNERVKEDLYASTYNPKMSLDLVPKERRSTRSTVASSSKDARKTKTNSDSKCDVSIAESKKKNTEPLKKKKIQNEDLKKDESETTVDMKTPKLDEDTQDLDEATYERLRAMQKMVSPPSLEKASSLDARLEFERQMGEIMEATKGNKGGIRRTRRQQLSSSSTSDDVSLKRSSVARRLRSRQSSQRSNSDSSKSSGDKKQTTKISGFQTIEPSQGDVITYDDPAGRVERERILAQLKAASPSQDGYSFHPIEVSDFPVDQIDSQNQERKEAFPDPPESNIKEKVVVNTMISPIMREKRSESDFEQVSTPAHRPVNMHISKPVQAPEPISLLEEDDKETIKQESRKKYKFLLSAMEPQEKIRYSALVEELGGVICEAQYFTMECTHAVVGTPSRNEKFLASVAAGKWVLHKSYLEASREAGCFVNEEEHEWGTEAEPSKLTIAACRWRRKLEEERKSDPSAAAFKGWNVLLSVGSSVRQHGFKRMLEAGGGKVASISPPFNNTDGVTHAFVDTSKTQAGVIDYVSLHSSGIWVLRPDFIAEYLTQDPTPPTLKYVVQEVQKLTGGETNAVDSKKRKIEDERSSQKTKRTRK